MMFGLGDTTTGATVCPGGPGCPGGAITGQEQGGIAGQDYQALVASAAAGGYDTSQGSVSVNPTTGQVTFVPAAAGALTLPCSATIMPPTCDSTVYLVGGGAALLLLMMLLTGRGGRH